MRTVVILGGYGLLGRELAPTLLEHSGDRVVIAGRRMEAASAVAQTLAERFGGDRVEARLADAASARSVAAALRGADWLVLALDSATHLAAVIEGALDARVSCIDVLIAPGRLAIWEQYRARFAAAGLVVVTEAGVQPGLPGVLLRAALAAVPDARRVQVAAALKIQIPPDLSMPGSMVDLVGGFTTKPIAYAHGRPTIDWWSYLLPYRFVRFAPPFGRQALSVTGLPEVERIAARAPAVERVRFLVGGFNAVATWIVLPALIPLLWLPGRWQQRFVARVLFSVLRRFTRSPFGVAMLATAYGPRGRFALEIQHDHEYGLTAVAILALLEALAVAPPEPGVFLMAEIVEPVSFLTRLEALGARLRLAPIPPQTPMAVPAATGTAPSAG